MSTRTIQFRYYSTDNENNNPALTWAAYCASETFKPYSPILQLGIQTLPGTRFYINSSTTPITVGSTGIFELDVSTSSASINSLRIDQQSMSTINELNNGYLMIDLVYEDSGG